MFKAVAMLFFVILFSHCATDNPVSPLSSATGRDSIKQFIVDSLITDTLFGLDTAQNRYYFQQGNLESTGNIWDLGIEGTGLFALKLDSAYYFLRRPGKFFVDKDGYVVREFNGPRLLGWRLDTSLTGLGQADSIPAKSGPVPVNIPFNLVSPPRATTFVQLQGNLNSDAEGLGTILYTQPFYHRVDEFNTAALTDVGFSDNNIGSGGVVGGAAMTFADIAANAGAINSVRLTGLHNAAGRSLLIRVGDLMTVTATIQTALGGDETQTAVFAVIDDPTQAGRVGGSAVEYQVATLGQFLLAAQDFLTGSAWNNGGGSNASGVRIGILPDGKIRIENGAGSAAAVKNIAISSNRPISRTYVTSALVFESEIKVNSSNDTPDRLLRPALDTDHLYNPLYYDAIGNSITGAAVPAVFTANGQAIDLEAGDKVNITALIGNTPKNDNTLQMSQGVTLNSSTTMQDLLDAIRRALNLPEYDGSVQNNLSVDVNPVGTDDDCIPEGAIVIRGQPEIEFSINNLSIIANNASANTEAPTDFNTNMVVTQLQAARGSGVFDLSIELYDEIGVPHTFTMTFIHSGIKNPATWLWEVSTNKGETVSSGRRGTVTFGQDGSPSAFLFNDTGVNRVTIQPDGNVKAISIELQWGASGTFRGITQFNSPTTVAAVNQDGYTNGRMEDISIDEFGAIYASFSNGVTQNLYHIAGCDFPCKVGLRSVGYGYFAKTFASGSPCFGMFGMTIGGVLHPGAIELEP